MNILIIAGGQGTKIWPFSRHKSPKQFQKIIGNKSLLTHNVRMLLKKYGPKHIFISTKKMYKHIIKEQAPQIPESNILVEPDLTKGRGPGEGFSFLKLSMIAPNKPFTMLQSDCMYVPPKKYFQTLDVIDKMLRKDKKYISGGQVPKFPIMGVDYLSLGRKIKEENGTSVYEVKEFIGRKKEYDQTEKLIKENNVVIHTNLSSWYPELMLDAYKKYRPDWYELLMEIKSVIGTTNEDEKINKIYERFEEGATEEVTKRVLSDGYIVTFPFKWVDIGTWDSVYEYLSKGDGVYAEGNVVALESSRTLVKGSEPGKLIAVLGLKDMVVVDTKDILFVAPRDKVGSVKAIQDELRKQGLEDYL